MKQLDVSRVAILLALGVACSPLCHAQFNWGSCGSNGGSGSFNQQIQLQAIVDVGEFIHNL